MQAIHRVAKNTGILYIRMAITVFISLYSTRLILGALGVEDYGIYALVGGMISMLGFLNSSMAAATQRFMSYAQGAGDIDKVKHIFNMSTLLHIGIALLMVVVLEGMGYFFFDGLLTIADDRLPAAKMIYHFMVLSTFFTIISVPYDAVITSHENMLFFAVLGIVEAVLKLAIALYISYGTLELPSELNFTTESINITYSAYDNLIIYGLLMAILAVLMLMIRRVYCHKKYTECEFNLRKYYDKGLFKEITHFAGWSFLGSASGIATNYGQGILLNIFFGTKINSAQGIANQMSGQLEAFSSNMMRALNPVIVKNEGANNRKNMLCISLTGAKFSFVLFSIFAIPVLLEIEYIFNIWLIEVPEYATTFTVLLLFRRLVAQLFGTLSTSIMATGNIKAFQISTSMLEILPLIISGYLFVEGFSAYWLYAVLIITVLIRCFGITLYYVEKECGLDKYYFLKEVVLPSVICIFIAILLSIAPLLTMNAGLPRLIIITGIFNGSFLMLSYYYILNLDEKKSLINLMKKLKLRLT